jgi:hypothetical protein
MAAGKWLWEAAMSILSGGMAVMGGAAAACTDRRIDRMISRFMGASYG